TSCVPRSIRTALMLAIAVALVVACGSEGGSDLFQPPEPDASVLGPSTPFGPNGDGGPINSSCKPKTCEEQGIECGPTGDGCGGLIPDCGKRDPGLRCGGPNAFAKCVSPSIGTGCTPKTCAELGVGCGLAGDGCGGLLTCPSCGPGMQCGATGAPSQCVPT